ncbi:hypothetical protein MRX96_057365 [Rhipicephalus microplus]
MALVVDQPDVYWPAGSQPIHGEQCCLSRQGGVENAATDIPLLAMTHFHGPFDWDYRTVPQKHACLAMDDNRCNWARGKVLGGSSVINFQMHVRGNRRDFDHWQQEYGAFNWSYANVLPYFKKYENYMGPHPDRRFRGTEGKVPVTLSVTQTKLVSIFFESWPMARLSSDRLQWPRTNSNQPVNDFTAHLTDHIQELFSPAHDEPIAAVNCNPNDEPHQPSEQDRSKVTRIAIEHALLRISASTATGMNGIPAGLVKCLGKSALEHLAEIFATILKDGPFPSILFENQRAVGVQFKKQGTLLHRKVRAQQEIILSGGTIGSTQLLLLSGVGPARDLEELGIPVVANLPVGENLQDHMFMGGMAATTDVDAGLHPQNIDVVKEYARTKAVQTHQIGW